MELGRDHRVAQRVPAAARQARPVEQRAEGPRGPKGEGKSGERSKGIAQYFEHHPLKWEQRPLDDEAFKMLCEAGYKGNGECEH